MLQAAGFLEVSPNRQLRELRSEHKIKTETCPETRNPELHTPVPQTQSPEPSTQAWSSAGGVPFLPAFGCLGFGPEGLKVEAPYVEPNPGTKTHIPSSQACDSLKLEAYKLRVQSPDV